MRSTPNLNNKAANARRRPFTWLPLLVFAGATLAFMAPATSRAAHLGSITVGAQTPSTVQAGNKATNVVTIARGTGAGSSGAFTVTLSTTTTAPTGATYSFSPSRLEPMDCGNLPIPMRRCIRCVIIEPSIRSNLKERL